MKDRPNIVIVLADQWRLQATGYSGNAHVHTPNLDRLAKKSVNFTRAVSGCPVCSPYRASLITGQRPLTHGVFINDVPLAPDIASMGKLFSKAGYDTAYIGKWHLDGHGRSRYIPAERRHGFDYWKVLECTHDYFNSAYYAGNDRRKRFWPGYDAYMQTADACRWLRTRERGRPALLVLSWGPPHSPYQSAPEDCRRMYDQESIQLRPNVPESSQQQARRDLAGYYAHCTALDRCLAKVLKCLGDSDLSEQTILLFTSDHGDMLESQGRQRKQWPWDESIRVPFLLSGPGAQELHPRPSQLMITPTDILPTLLGLCGLDGPDCIEGRNLAPSILHGDDGPSDQAALLTCYQPFAETSRQRGGKEFRGLRTLRHTYVRDLDGPWLLYENEADPYQVTNLVGCPEHAHTIRRLDEQLTRQLQDEGDQFLSGDAYVRRFGYIVGPDGAAPFDP